MRLQKASISTVRADQTYRCRLAHFQLNGDLVGNRSHRSAHLQKRYTASWPVGSGGRRSLGRQPSPHYLQLSTNLRHSPFLEARALFCVFSLSAFLGSLPLL